MNPHIKFYRFEAFLFFNWCSSNLFLENIYQLAFFTFTNSAKVDAIDVALEASLDPKILNHLTCHWGFVQHSQEDFICEPRNATHQVALLLRILAAVARTKLLFFRVPIISLVFQTNGTESALNLGCLCGFLNPNPSNILIESHFLSKRFFRPRSLHLVYLSQIFELLKLWKLLIHSLRNYFCGLSFVIFAETCWWRLFWFQLI